MRRIIAFITMLALALAFLQAGLAEEEPVDGEFEYYVLDDGTVEISQYLGNARKVAVPDRVGGYRVTGIGSYAFSRNDRLAAVIIPEGIRKINMYAFSECYNLHTVQLPESLKEIEDVAFEDCTGISGILLPEGLEIIGENPFQGCTGLEFIRFAGGNAVYEVRDGFLYHKETLRIIGCAPKALDRRLEIPEGTRSIGARAFAFCGEIREAVLPEGLEEIGDYAFMECHNLSRIEFPSSLAAIGCSAFNTCPRLEEADLPEGLRELGDLCFYSCENLRSVSIPDSLASMGANPFCACSALKQINLSENHPYFSFSDGLLVSREWQVLVCHLISRQEKKVSVPDSILVIGNAAFMQDMYLTEAVIPSSVRIIEQCAFSRCRSLETLMIAEGTEKIGMNAFASCTELKEITLPDSLQNIEYGAFAFCNRLAAADLPEKVRKPWGFVNCSSVTLTVHTAEAEDWCRENGIACVRGPEQDGQETAGSAEQMRDGYGSDITVFPDAELLAGRSSILLTEDEAVKQILFRGLPLVSVSRSELNHVPCLILEQEDGSRLVLEELFTVETEKRYLPEESLVCLCAWVFGDDYDYFLSEPEMPESGQTAGDMLAETDSIRKEAAATAGQAWTNDRLPYGGEENAWSFPGVNPYEGKSHRLVLERYLTDWFDAHGVSWRTGGQRRMKGRTWYVINQAGFEEPEEMYGIAMMAEPDREEEYLIPEAGLYTFAARCGNGGDLYERRVRDSGDFDAAYAEILLFGGVRAEVAYEAITAEEGKPFRVRITLLDYVPDGEPVTAAWNYALKAGNTIDELEYTFGQREPVALAGRTTFLEADPSPAAFINLTLSRNGYRKAATASVPVAGVHELPAISLRAADPYYAVAGEPYTVEYTVDGKGYEIAGMTIAWETRMLGTGDYETTEAETPETPSGRASIIPTEAMESVNPILTVTFANGVVYTRDGGAYSEVGGTAYEPAVIRLHLDREELTAGEPATVSYEIIGLENLSTLSAYTVLTPEGGTFDDRIYESCDIIPAASGTFEVTPSGEGTLYLGLSVDGTNGYYIGAYMTDIPVRAQAQETR